MHELKITESILEIALRHALPARAKSITDVYLVIGQLSSVVDDSVQFYWEIIARDTLAASAELHFRRVPAEFACMDCQRRYGMDGAELACPECGSNRIKVVSGEEFYVESIEIENS